MIKVYIKECFVISVIKTIYFNFKYFPFKVACKLPVLIYKKTDLTMTRGVVNIISAPRLGMIKIGKPEGYSLDKKNNRTKWKCEGVVTFNGCAAIGRGSVIRVLKGGNLQLGMRFNISGNSNIVCGKEIIIGDECLLSWNILVMDTDFHKILNNNGEITNFPSSINIGNRVWIGCDCKVLKGVVLPNDCVVAAGSIITKQYEQDGIIVGSMGVLKTEITWKD